MGKTKIITEPTISKVSFYRSGKGHIATRTNIPKPFFEAIGVTMEKPYIEISYKDGKIVIEKEE